MLDRIRRPLLLPREPRREPDPATPASAGPRSLSALRIAAAQLLLLTGASTTMQRAGAQTPRERPSRTRRSEGAGATLTERVTAWAPLIVGSLAAATQIAFVSRPSISARGASRALSGAALAAGVAELTESLSGLPRGDRPSPAGLALGSAGALGLLLDWQEQRLAAARSRPRRRSRPTRWLDPRRRMVRRIVIQV